MTAVSAPITLMQRLSYAQSSKTTTGTVIRIVKYLIKATKVAQNDYLITATAIPSGNADSIINVSGYTVDSSSNAVQETFTYTHTGDKLAMTSATVGTTYIELTVQE